ncbi:MAG: DegT/DnrJ/EryC1/StrS family aminotransferase [Campylobacterota bacterium]|nr:DegT/DnrJ/EryC1/StrS family aminotransferase [Campylobacterota bacterium]
MKKIQVLKPYYRVDECLDEIRECLEIGWTGMGFKTNELEDAWKKYTNLPNAYYVNSATSGLHVAFKLLKDEYKWDEKSEIITTPFTFVSTNHAIVYENMKPVFADVDDSLNLDPKSVEDKITPNTKAIIFVGIAGNANNLLEIIQIAKEHNLKIILDAAHMAGSKIDGKHVGFDVDVTVFSFQSVKNMPTADSGMVCFANEKLDKKSRIVSWLGINKDTYSRSNEGTYKWYYDVSDVGYKYHGNSVMASLGLVALKYLDQDNARRREITEAYIECLRDKVKYIQHENCTSSRHLFQIVVENREDVIEHLQASGIYPGVHYVDNTYYEPYSADENICSKSRYYSDRVLSLPLHLEMTQEDIQYVSQKVLEALDA